MEAIIFDAPPGALHLAARSQRSLLAAGVGKITVCTGNLDAMRLPARGAVLLLKAGAWLRHPQRFQEPPFHPAGHPLVAIGHVLGSPPADVWHGYFERHGGDFSAVEELPPVVCEWFDEEAVNLGLAGARLRGTTLPAGAALKPPRIIHWSPLDAGYDTGLRCLQVVTSLQHGGAERIAWELARELPRMGMPTRLVALGKPLRRTLPDLPGTLDLSRYDRQTRAAKLAVAAHHFGADVLHGHLIDGEDMRLFKETSIPLATTIHNTRAAWPAGLETLQAGDADLLIACAQEVEREMRELNLPVPVRTVWNGIAVEDFISSISNEPRKTSEYVLACVANPRPQKRLHLLPGILAATQREVDRRGLGVRMRLILAGEASSRSPSAVACYEEVEREAAKHNVSEAITWTHGALETREVLAQANAAICCSAYEGLSLAHLEGLAMGLPLISTDAGGTRELARGNPALKLLPLDASAEDFAVAIIEEITSPSPSGRDIVERDFSVRRMARRTSWLLSSLVRQKASPPPSGILFVTNNLSTGGAQSSLRRLATAWHAQGVSVRVALLQEHPELPTPGRTALLEAGVPVIVPQAAGVVDAPEAIAEILDTCALCPPATVVFWNAIPVYKVLLADALWSCRIFDVSPGEMYFASLERYFTHPRPGLPYRSAQDYGRRLAGVIVKYHAETALAAKALACPTCVIPNGVALPEQAVGISVKSGTSPFRWGTAARLSPQKRLEDLLKAFRLALPDLPPCELHIAGGPEHDGAAYVEELHRLAEGLPVVWRGDLEDMGAFHAQLDVFVMISEPAGCPNASLEALAAGLPVIATDFGGASEQVMDGKTGLLVPNRNAGALAAAMVQMAGDENLRRNCARGAREHVESQFSLERMEKAYRDVLLGS